MGSADSAKRWGRANEGGAEFYKEHKMERLIILDKLDDGDTTDAIGECNSVLATYGTYLGWVDSILAPPIIEDYNEAIDKMDAQLRSCMRCAETLAEYCVDGQNELHGIIHGMPAKRTLRDIELKLRMMVSEIANTLDQ